MQYKWWWNDMNLLICASPQWQGSDYCYERWLLKRYSSWLLPCLFVFFEQMPNLPAKAEHVSEQLDIRVLERSLLSGQQCQETFPPLSERGLHSYCFVEGRAADHRGNATRPLLSAVFLHGPVDTVTHIQGHKESYRCCANSNRPSLNKQGWHTHHFLNTVNPL